MITGIVRGRARLRGKVHQQLDQLRTEMRQGFTQLVSLITSAKS